MIVNDHIALKWLMGLKDPTNTPRASLSPYAMLIKISYQVNLIRNLIEY